MDRQEERRRKKIFKFLTIFVSKLLQNLIGKESCNCRVTQIVEYREPREKYANKFTRTSRTIR